MMFDGNRDTFARFFNGHGLLFSYLTMSSYRGPKSHVVTAPCGIILEFRFVITGHHLWSVMKSIPRILRMQ